MAQDRADRGGAGRRPHQGPYLAAHHASIRGRRGTHKAVGATRHDLLLAYWHVVVHVVHDQVDYIDLGGDWATRRHFEEHRVRRLVRQLNARGQHVTVTPATAGAT